MPDLRTHQRLVLHNQEVAKYLLDAGDTYLDWVVTVLFYTALHLVDQVLAYTLDLHPRNHRQRHAAIVRHPEMVSIYPDYRELEYQSRRSRYQGAQFTSQDIQRLMRCLERIEQTVQHVLSHSSS